jgi:hypothetical protein
MKTNQKEKPGLGLQPEARLFEQAQGGGQESLNLLMARHEGLVFSSVNRQNLGDLSYDEADQAGRIGLWRAIEGFDPQRGNRFLTFPHFSGGSKKLIEILVFELFRCQISQSRMTARAIVKAFQVKKDVGLRLGPGLIVLEMDLFGFEAAKEALHGGIIILDF